MKFWNMPWGPPAFNVVDKALVESYVPPAGLPRVTYGLVEWATWTQTFATAVDSGTGPAVSSGGGIQAFQFAAEGKIAYADEIYSTPSAASGAASGGSTKGWTFWAADTPEGRFTLAALREEFLARQQ